MNFTGLIQRIARILIRYRHFLLILMIALGVGGVCMLPEVKIVSDMSTYLPDDSRMKHGPMFHPGIVGEISAHI